MKTLFFSMMMVLSAASPAMAAVSQSKSATPGLFVLFGVLAMVLTVGIILAIVIPRRRKRRRAAATTPPSSPRVRPRGRRRRVIIVR